MLSGTVFVLLFLAELAPLQLLAVSGHMLMQFWLG